MTPTAKPDSLSGTLICRFRCIDVLCMYVERQHNQYSIRTQVTDHRPKATYCGTKCVCYIVMYLFLHHVRKNRGVTIECNGYTPHDAE